MLSSEVLPKSAHNYILTDSSGKPRLRGDRDAGHFALAVDPKGRIRTLSYSINGGTSKLIGRPIREGKRLAGFTDVQLAQEWVDRGWSLLEDLAANDAERANVRVVYDWYKIGFGRRVGARARPLADAYLPGAVIERREKPIDARCAEDDLPPPAVETKAVKR